MEKGEKHIALPLPRFVYEVNRATASLLYLLWGMELVRSNEPFLYNRHDQLSPDDQKFALCFQRLSYVDVPLSLTGISSDLNKLLEREGEAEQLAFKGWVEEVYNSIWESRLRDELRDRLRDELRETLKDFEITLKVDVLGDLRHIRNDLVHNKGIASEDEAGKCKVLKWFGPGDHIILGMHHVFDFLNQLGFMTMRLSYKKFLSGTIIWWGLSPDMDGKTPERNPIPKLVSLRTFIDTRLKDKPYAISVVFENGVFVNTVIDAEIPTELIPDDLDPWEKIRSIYEKKIVHLDEDGNVRFTNGSVMDRERLYRKAIAFLSKKESTIDREARPPFPPFQIAKPKS